VNVKECLDLTNVHNTELVNLAKPLWARLKDHFFVVTTLGYRMTKAGESRLE
jgi:hypothetical protein